MQPYSESIRASLNFDKITILTIEDNEDHRFLMKSALEQSMPGLNSVECAARADAVDYFKKISKDKLPSLPKIILLDLYLPSRQEGLATLGEIRALFDEHQISPIPIVVFSNSEAREDIDACYAAGANAYVVKHTEFEKWAGYFDKLRDFWLETVSLPVN